MQHSIALLSLIFLVSCATKYVMPTNRFITPEAQGGVFRGQFELQQTEGVEATIDTSENTVDRGVTYNNISRTGFLISTSFLDTFDLIWSHVGGGNSMLGGKFQFIGGTRTTNSAGHKMAIVGLIGGNEHETDDEAIEFTLNGQEAMLVYGFRLNPNFMPYASLSYARYNFEGKISAPAPLAGLEPSLQTAITSLNGGIELAFYSVFVKAECTYQQIATSDTKDKNQMSFGFSGGFAW